jgi:hypothetical protein
MQPCQDHCKHLHHDQMPLSPGLELEPEPEKGLELEPESPPKR